MRKMIDLWKLKYDQGMFDPKMDLEVRLLRFVMLFPFSFSVGCIIGCIESSLRLLCQLDIRVDVHYTNASLDFAIHHRISQFATTDAITEITFGESLGCLDSALVTAQEAVVKNPSGLTTYDYKPPQIFTSMGWLFEVCSFGSPFLLHGIPVSVSERISSHPADGLHQIRLPSI